MTNPIAISISPNVESDDVILAIKVLLNPFLWNRKSDVKRLEANFEKYFGGDHKAFAVNSGRSALYVILKALGIGKGDEVVLQAFTCVAVPNSIIWNGAKPIYVDIDKNYNLDPLELKQKITPQTKAIIVQNTFGTPANYDVIRKIISSCNHKVYLIEDCAHALGAEYKGNLVGTIGDVSFFSFGRDKVISSIFGGMILTKDSYLKSQILKQIELLKETNVFWTVQQLFHPPFFSIVKPFYNHKIVRVVISLFQRIGLISKAVYSEEKRSINSGHFPKKMSPALAILALNQLNKLNRFNSKRAKIADYYSKHISNSDIYVPEKVNGSIYLRFTIETDDRENMLKYFRKHAIYLGDWYVSPVTPSLDLNAVNFKASSLEKVVNVCKRVVNLPTSPTLSMEDIDKIVRLVNLWKPTKQKK